MPGSSAVRIHPPAQQLAHPVGQPMMGSGHQQVLDHLLGRVLALAQKPPRRPAVAIAEPELEEQLQPVLLLICSPTAL